MTKTREIVMSGKQYEALRRHLLGGSAEQLAFALASPNQGKHHLKLIVDELILVLGEGLKEQAPTYVEARAEAVRPVLAACAREGKSLVEFHSHPFAGSDVAFSGLDDRSDLEKYIYISAKIPGIYHATVVIGRDSVAARMWWPEAGAVVPVHSLRIVDVPLKVIPTTTAQPLRDAYHSLLSQGCLRTRGGDYNWQALSRQVQAFGREGQERLRQACVAIVGVGGVGSVVAATLGHMGVGRMLLIDPDSLDETSLNRWLGGSVTGARDGIRKVEAAREYIERVNPAVEVEISASSIFDTGALEHLKAVDVVFGCTDSEASRLVLNRMATQFCLPYIDCGCGIMGGGGRVEEAGGQVRVVLPDGPCLECMDGIDRQRAALEFMSPGDREVQVERGYVTGADVPAPSVMPLNETVASLAAMEFMNLLLGFKTPQSYLFYDALRSTVQPISVPKRPSCICCGQGSAARLGDLEPLPTESAETGFAVPGVSSDS